MITGAQIRMARAALDWSRERLASKTKLSVTTIRNIEHGDVVPREGNLNDIQQVFEHNGLEFTDQEGVRKKSNIVAVFEGESALSRFFDDVYYTILPTNGAEILTSGVSESDYMEVDESFVNLHLERMAKLPNISHKILSRKGDKNQITPYATYRWVSDEYFHSTPFYVYGDKMAVILWGRPMQILVFNHPRLSQSYRKQFFALWNFAQPHEDYQNV